MPSSAAVATAPNVTARQQATLDRVRRFARMMDAVVEVPWLDMRIGLDALVGLIPVYGDVATALANCYIPIEAYRLGAPPLLVARMLVNVVVDALIGIVPVIGDLIDAVWKPNMRNVAMLEDFLAER